MTQSFDAAAAAWNPDGKRARGAIGKEMPKVAVGEFNFGRTLANLSIRRCLADVGRSLLLTLL
jgi:hypothetical protein